jgi:uncharacterized protein
MIRINIARDNDGNIRKFTIKGHAGFAEKGSDIVCSAVSAVAYMAVGALKAIADIGGHTEKKEGYMEISLPMGISFDSKENAKIILETAEIGFKQIEAEYGKYVMVMDEEV